MKSVEIYIVRHGETSANSSNIIQGQNDVPLNETGIRQAERLAERLRGEHFDAVYSSDLSRALATARLIAPEADVITTPELREWDLGDWVGNSLESVRERYPDELDAFLHDREELRIPGGESKREAYGRIGHFLDAAVQRHPGERLLVVSHCGMIRAMLKHVLGSSAPWPRQPQLGNASLSKVMFAGCWQLGFWNDTSHLGGAVSRAGGY